MITRFVQVSWGLQHTNVFLHINTIKSYIQSYQKCVDVDSTTLMNETIAFLSQDRMEVEINQHIRISDKLAKEELHEYLTGWIEYFESNLNNVRIFEQKINDYNTKRLEEYAAIIQKMEDSFKQTTEYKTLKHLDFYEVQYSIGSLVPSPYYPIKTRLEQYRKFFEAPDPDLIDIEYLPKYIEEIAQPIISRCIKTAKKRLSYLKGGDSQQQLSNVEIKQAITSPLAVPSNRLKVNLTVEQLTMLFRLLKDCGLTNAKFDKEIHTLIAEQFETIGRDNKKISVTNVGRLFSSTDTDVLNFWIAKFTEMIKIAQKK